MHVMSIARAIAHRRPPLCGNLARAKRPCVSLRCCPSLPPKRPRKAWRGQASLPAMQGLLLLPPKRPWEALGLHVLLPAKRF